MPVRAGRVPHMGGVQLEAPTEAWKRDIEDIGVLRAEIQAKVRDAERLSAEKSSEEAEHARRERLLAAQARSSLRDSLADTFMASMAAGAANQFLTNLKARHMAQRKQGEDAQPDDEQEQPTVEQEQPTEEQVGEAAAGQPSVAMAGRVNMADVGRARRRERQRRRVERERSDPQHTREWAKLRAAAHIKATTHTTRVTTAPAVRGRSRRSRYAQAQGGRRRRRRARRSAGPAGAPPDDVSQQQQEAAETTTGAPTRRWALEQVPLVLTIACSDLPGYRPPSAKAPKIGANGQPIVQLEAEDVHAVLEVQRSGDWEEWGRTEECQHAGCPQFVKCFDCTFYPQFALGGAHHEPYRGPAYEGMAQAELLQGSRGSGGGAAAARPSHPDEWVRQGQHCRLTLFAKRYGKAAAKSSARVCTMEFTLAELMKVPGRCQGQRLDGGAGVLAVRAVVPGEKEADDMDVDFSFGADTPLSPNNSQLPASPPSESGSRSPSPQRDSRVRGISTPTGTQKESSTAAKVRSATTPAAAANSGSTPMGGTLLLRLEASAISNVPPPTVSERKQTGFFLHVRRKIAIGEGALFDYELVAKTDVCWCALGQNPLWPPLELTTERLCRNRPSTPLRIELYKYCSDGFHLQLSAVHTSLKGLLQAAPGKSGLPPRLTHLSDVVDAAARAARSTSVMPSEDVSGAISTLKHISAVNSEQTPKKRASKLDEAGAPPAETWAHPLPLYDQGIGGVPGSPAVSGLPVGSDGAVGLLHVLVRDSGPEGRVQALAVADRADQEFLCALLREEDVRRSDLKDEVKEARRLVSERTKFCKEFTQRRQIRQRRHFRDGVDEHGRSIDLDVVANRLLPRSASQQLKSTQGSRDLELFRHMSGDWHVKGRRGIGRTNSDSNWHSNSSTSKVKPRRHVWRSRAIHGPGVNTTTEDGGSRGRKGLQLLGLHGSLSSSALSDRDTLFKQQVAARATQLERQALAPYPADPKPTSKTAGEARVRTGKGGRTTKERRMSRRLLRSSSLVVDGDEVDTTMAAHDDDEELAEGLGPWRRPAPVSVSGGDGGGGSNTGSGGEAGCTTRQALSQGQGGASKDPVNHSPHRHAPDDPLGAGGSTYFQMHATRYVSARGAAERRQAQQQGFTAGALARIYDDGSARQI